MTAPAVGLRERLLAAAMEADKYGWDDPAALLREAAAALPDGWVIRWQKEGDDSLILVGHPEHGAVVVFKDDETPRITTGPVLYWLARSLIGATAPTPGDER